MIYMGKSGFECLTMKRALVTKEGLGSWYLGLETYLSTFTGHYRPWPSAGRASAFEAAA